MGFAYKRTVKCTSWVLCSVAVSCAEWPRYKHTSSIDHDALSPDQSPEDGIPVNWTEIAESDEPNDRPADPIPLSIGDGITAQGILSGLGWAADEAPDRNAECGGTLAFPPAVPGNYTGDIDWVSMQTEDTGTLCLHIETDIDTARLDVALYALDDCYEPVSVFVYNGTENPIGIDVPSSGSSWSISVGKDLTLGVGLAGFWPDDANIEANWSMELALVPSVAGAGSNLCPEPQ